MLNEAREYLSDGRVRPDHYRGLTKAQITGVYAENEAVEKYRKEMSENQFDEGAQFRAESDHVNVLVAAAEYHAQNEKLRERLDVQEHLQKMMIEERERKAAIAKDRIWRHRRGRRPVGLREVVSRGPHRSCRTRYRTAACWTRHRTATAGLGPIPA